MDRKDKTSRILAILALVVALGAGVWSVVQGLPGAEVAVPRSYSCAVYTEQGCAKYVVASGGEIEVQSGGVLAVRSGATASFNDSLVGITGTVTVTGNALIDGAADVVQLRVQGYTTPTTDLMVVEQSDGTNVVAVDAAGVEITGTLSASGAVTLASTLDVASTINYGTNNLYPLGYDIASTALDVGTYTVTDTQAIALSNVTTPTVCLCSLQGDAAAGNAFCSCNISGATVTLKGWETDASAGTTGVVMQYVVIGQE